MATQRVLVSYVDAVNALQLSYQEIDYDTGVSTVLHTDSVPLTDPRLPGIDPAVTNLACFTRRVSADTVLVGFGGGSTSSGSFVYVNYFGVVHIDAGAGTFSLGTFLQNYTWGTDSDEEIWWGTDCHAIDDTHVLCGGQLRDAAPGAGVARWHVLDVSGATPAIAWGYTDASLGRTGAHVMYSLPQGLVANGWGNFAGSYHQYMLDIDMGAHTVVWRNGADPSAHTVPVPLPAGQNLIPYNERDIPLLTANKWACVFCPSDTESYCWAFVVDQSTGDVTSKVMLGQVVDFDNNFEEGYTEMLIDSRGEMWALVDLQEDGPLQTMVLARIALDSNDITGVDARIVVDSDETVAAFSSTGHRDLYDLGNGVAASWSKYDSTTNAEGLYASIVSDDTTVRTSAVELLPMTVGSSGSMSSQAVFVGTAAIIPAATTEVISSGAAGGEAIETTTTSQAGPGVPKLALPAGPVGTGLHESHRADYSRLAPALIVYGRPVNEPLLSGVSYSGGSITTASVIEELAAALDVDLGSTWRWLPGPDFHVSGADYVWDAIAGIRQWTFPGANAPYLDPAFSLPTNHGDRDKPALIFPGGAYGQLPVDPHAQFTVAIVARLLHPFTSHYYDLVSSPSAATDPTKGTDLNLRYRGGRLRAFVDHNRYTDFEPEQMLNRSIYRRNVRRGRAATIIVWSVDQSHLRFGVTAARSRHISKQQLHAAPGNFDLNFFLGRNGAVYSDDSTAHMQLFDLAVWRDNALTRRQIRHVLHKLNGVYGVHQR